MFVRFVMKTDSFINGVKQKVLVNPLKIISVAYSGLKDVETITVHTTFNKDFMTKKERRQQFKQIQNTNTQKLSFTKPTQPMPQKVRWDMPAPDPLALELIEDSTRLQ